LAEYVDNYGVTNHITKSDFQINIEPLDYIYANLMSSIDLRKKYDSVSQMDFIYYFEENGIVYYFNRFATKRILMFKGKEVLKAGAIKKFEDGSIMEVYKTYDESDNVLGATGLCPIAPLKTFIHLLPPPA